MSVTLCLLLGIGTYEYTNGEPGLILRCVECGELYVGSPTNDGDLVPDGAASGGGVTSAAATSSSRFTGRIQPCAPGRERP